MIVISWFIWTVRWLILINTIFIEIYDHIYANHTFLHLVQIWAFLHKRCQYLYQLIWWIFSITCRIKIIYLEKFSLQIPFSWCVGHLNLVSSGNQLRFVLLIFIKTSFLPIYRSKYMGYTRYKIMILEHMLTLRIHNSNNNFPQCIESEVFNLATGRKLY